MLDYGHTLINEDHVDTSRLLTQSGPLTLDTAESLFSYFLRLTVTKIDEHEDTTSPSFGRRVNAAMVSVPRPLPKLSPTHECLLHCGLIVDPQWLLTFAAAPQHLTRAGIRRMHRPRDKRRPTDLMVCELCQESPQLEKGDFTLGSAHPIRRYHHSLMKAYFQFSIQGCCDVRQCESRQGVV